MIEGAYKALSAISAPVLRTVLAARTHAGKEDPLRSSERRGYPSMVRPSGPLLWVHAASVGESLSVLPSHRRFYTRSLHGPPLSQRERGHRHVCWRIVYNALTFNVFRISFFP